MFYAEGPSLCLCVPLFIWYLLASLSREEELRLFENLDRRKIVESLEK